MTCSDGVRVAKIWDSRGRSAIRNGCQSEWVVMWINGRDSGASTDYALSVAPGAHFNWSQKDFLLHEVEGDMRFSMRLSPRPGCNEDEGSDVVLRGSHGKRTRLEDC